MSKTESVYGKVWLHILLFLITLFSTTLAGTEWMHGRLAIFDFVTVEKWLTWQTFSKGFAFSLPFLAVLTVHEFGHYFAARYHKVRVSLPYYLPLFVGVSTTIGTLGAFIRIKERIFSRKEYFDIGVAGPVAGFLAALPLLWYGFTHIPGPEYVFAIHPEYAEYGPNYANVVYTETTGQLALGKNLLFWLLEHTLVDPGQMPPRYEVVHFPYLFAGYLTLFFTALNLLPIGQLDGGHIGYALLGYEKFNRLAGFLFVLLITYAGLGILTPELMQSEYWYMGWVYVGYLLLVLRKVVPTFRTTLLLTAAVMGAQAGLTLFWPGLQGYPGWLVFGLVLSRFIGIYHPPAPNERPLSTGRKWLGAAALVIFILCFSPTPFVIE